MSNRRVVKKVPLSKEKISDKKVSTKDKGNKITKANYFLLGGTPKNNKLKLTISKIESEKKPLTLIPTTTSPPSLTELKEKTSKLKEELDYLNYKYEKEQKGSIKEVAKYNEDLREKAQLVAEHSQENKRLMNILKEIQEDVNERYSKAMNKNYYKLIKNNNNNNERTIEDIKDDIYMKEEQIENIRKLAECSKAEYERIEDLLEDVDNGLEEHIKFDLENVTQKIEKVNNKIKELKSIKSQHKYCAKEIKNLKSKLTLLNNEIEFETKKNKMIMSYNTIKNSIEGEVETSEESEDYNYFDKENDLVTNKVNYSLRVRNLILKRGTPRQEKISKSAFKYIQNEFDLIKQKSDRLRKRRRNNGERVRLFDNISLNERNLFTERESEILKKIIPEEFLDKYNERFEKKKIEKEEIEQKFDENDDKKFDNQQIKLRIEAIALKVKEKERIGADLNIKFRRNKVNIDKLKNEIFKMQKSVKEQQEILNKLNKKKKGYSKAIQNFLKMKNKNEE
jgi:hypothetical protein